MHRTLPFSFPPSAKSLLNLTRRKSNDLEQGNISKQMCLHLIHTRDPHQLFHLVGQDHQDRGDHQPLHSLGSKFDPSEKPQTKDKNEKVIQKPPACPYHRLRPLPGLELPINLSLCPLINLPPTFLHLPPSSCSHRSSITDQ